MADLSAPIRDKSADVVKSGTLRVTLGTQAVAIIAALVTGLDPLLGDSFSAGQKTAIIVAAIAFVAVAQLADVLARAWTSSAELRANSAALHATPLPMPLPVHVRTPEAAKDYAGAALESRADGSEYFVVRLPVNGKPGEPGAWVDSKDLQFV